MKVLLISSERGRNLFCPNCELSAILMEFKSKGRKHLIYFSLTDILTLIRYGWEVHYKGTRNKMIDALGAIYDDKEKKKSKDQDE
jgi:hypothetical protein